jgi:glycosyltransferase involved in cell wall biosynthesis
VAFAPRGATLPRGVEHVALEVPHYSIRELIVVGRAAERARLDVFHAPHYVVPLTRVPIVVTIHDLIHLHQPMRNPLASIYARAMLRRAVHKAARVLTVSDAVRRELETELGARDVLVTPNGIDPPVALQVTPASPPLFLFVGNDKPHKNVETLVAAFVLLREQRPDARLVLVGGDFLRFSSRPGLETPGFVTDAELSTLYRSCTALVIPSFEEGFGLPAAEAMAHGAAVITSTAAALVEVSEGAALHVEARDASALMAAMRTLLVDDSLRARLGAAGVERARSFTWKRCAERTLEAYRDAGNRGTPWNIGSKLRF